MCEFAELHKFAQFGEFSELGQFGEFGEFIEFCEFGDFGEFAELYFQPEQQYKVFGKVYKGSLVPHKPNKITPNASSGHQGISLKNINGHLISLKAFILPGCLMPAKTSKYYGK